MIAQRIRTNRFSLRLRLLFILLLSAFVLMLIATFAIWAEHHRQSHKASQQEILSIGSLVQGSMSRAIRMQAYDVIEEIKAELQAHRRIQRVVRVSEAAVVIDAYHPQFIGALAQELFVGLNKEQLINTSQSGLLASEFVGAANKYIVYVPLVVPAVELGKPQRHVLLFEYEHRDDWQQALQHRWLELLLALGLLTTAGLLLWWYLQQKIASPIEHLLQAIEDFHLGKTLAITQAEPLSELGQLTSAINNMVARRQQDEMELLKLSAAIEQSQDGILITNKAGVIHYVNSALLSLSGYKPEELIGQNPRIFGTGKTPVTTFIDMWTTLNAGKAWSGEFINKNSSGIEYIERQTISPLRDPQGKITHFVGIKRDITEEKALAQRLHFLAYYDVLTHLPNRLALLEQIAVRQKHPTTQGLLMINIDRMKFINDARGYSYGNQVIQRFAERINALSPHFLAHLGADSFCILLTENDKIALNEQCQQTADKVLLASKQPLNVLDDALVVSCSLGISIANTLTVGDELLQRAETAMHIAKRQGGNNLAYYNDVDGKQALLMFQTEKALRLGLEHNELKLYLQSQLDEQGQLAGAEALVRWQHPSEGLISPGVFIPVAERSDLIIALDNWVLQQSCQVLASWQKQGKKLTLSVNISPRHVRHVDFVSDVTRLLDFYQLDATALVLEVTEGILVEDITASIAKMQTLAALGVQFAIDDFGTGYSSLSYIRNLPVQELKIDQSFIKGIPLHTNDVAMVNTIISVARQLGLRLVAEGVETAEQNAFCQREGLWAQGYFIDKPLPVVDWQQRWFNP
ncbi:putative bifunctional diguanylate cyclase/phosphodiesterase [Alishewanella tabrizica]|uniref:Uncharacterized protein n=1 Tax=Alishewanella tabrizica TaxID=671278 RepID=A0ABQ2WHW6_9ALTE|nr:bifunctional diguanylate cyclase/phosphodiesterase [Alishewanella tabrizica]GGW53963.1 hypothetical protein GCM10008111_07720 [Alishewanella tabrizica]